MKNLLLLAFSLFATASFAQATFSMNPDTASVTVDIYETDIEAHNEMTNLTGTSRQIKWERTIISITPDTLVTQVCDPIACFAYWVDTHTFTLEANATIPMIVHLLKKLEQDASAIVQLVNQQLLARIGRLGHERRQIGHEMGLQHHHHACQQGGQPRQQGHQGAFVSHGADSQKSKKLNQL